MTTNHAPRNAAHPFAIVSSGILRNPDLSSVECRVISILLNLPQGWQPNAKHLSTQMREGTSAIQKAITRLKQLGYLVCRSIRDVVGRFLRSDWEINEIPTRPNCKNMDVRGNVVTVDRGGKASKNLRREAKQRVKSGQKLTPKSQAETRTITTFDPYTENPYTGNPNTGFSDRSNIDISNIHSNLEREAGFDKQEEGEELDKDLGLRFDKSPQSFVQTSAFRSGKSSGAVESDYEPADCRPLFKGGTGNDELREFQSQLEDLGKRLGRKSPVAWAYTIVKNLNTGKTSTYWEEFKAGIPLGTSEQREWEIAPGVACAIAIQCLEQDYLSRPGTTPQEAALKAARTIARPKEMAAVWESIKSQVMFRRSEWQRQSELGVQSPVLDSWMTPKVAVSVKEVAAALQEIQSALPGVLKTRSEFSQSQELKALESQTESALTQIEASQFRPTADVVVEDVLAESDTEETTVDDDTAAIVAEAKASISAVLRKFARPSKRTATLAANMVEANCDTILTPAKASTSGGLADYLLQVEVTEDEEIW